MPDFDSNAALQAQLAANSLLRASQATGGSGRSPLLACVLPGGAADVNVGAQLTTQNNGLKFDATFRPTAQRRPGIVDGLCKQLGLTVQDIAKGFQDAASKGAVQQFPVQQVNNITEITGSGLSNGGSFADMIANSRSTGGNSI